VLPPKSRILMVAAVAIAGVVLSPLGITSAEAALLTTANTAVGPGSLNPHTGGQVRPTSMATTLHREPR